MPASTDNGATRTQTVAERITVALVPKVAEELQRLQDRTSLSKTDLTNRAITLYEFIDAQQRATCSTWLHVVLSGTRILYSV